MRLIPRSTLGRLAALVAIVVVAVIAWVLVSPLFIDEVVDEGLPSLAQVATMTADEKAKVMDDMMAAAEARPDNTIVEPMDAGPARVATGTFRDADAVHKSSGDALIYRLEDGSHVVRLENFRSTNGPDLFVWLTTTEGPQLSAAVTAGETLSLGALKGNVGNQNYPVPAGTDVAAYNSVVIWCRTFGVLFAAADLSPAGG